MQAASVMLLQITRHRLPARPVLLPCHVACELCRRQQGWTHLEVFHPQEHPQDYALYLLVCCWGSCAGAGENMNGSQFYLTLGDDLYSLDEKHTIFGEVAEGLEVLEAINDVPCDDGGRPLQNIR